MGENSRAVIEERVSSHSPGILRNAGIQLFLDPGAQLTFSHWQDLHTENRNFLSLDAHLQRDSRLELFTGLLGSAFTRTDINCRLLEPGGSADIRGAYLAREHQHFDQYTRQIHLAPHTESNMLHKGAVAGRARAVNQGLIRISPEGQQTVAYQSSRNLLLSPRAEADVIPALEIETDDVSCSHGAAAGTVDEEMVYYLTSRGLSRSDAVLLLVGGFLEESLLNLRETTHRFFRERFEKVLGELTEIREPA
jgi:Fe-S cluster assembly protein SufD